MNRKGLVVSLEFLNSLQDVNSNIGIHRGQTIKSDRFTMSGTKVESFSFDCFDVFAVSILGQVGDTENVQHGIGLDVGGDGVLADRL